jgi:hypothetical protein
MTDVLWIAATILLALTGSALIVWLVVLRIFRCIERVSDRMFEESTERHNADKR